jgi:hypothetical protein
MEVNTNDQHLTLNLGIASQSPLLAKHINFGHWDNIVIYIPFKSNHILKTLNGNKQYGTIMKYLEITSKSTTKVKCLDGSIILDLDYIVPVLVIPVLKKSLSNYILTDLQVIECLDGATLIRNNVKLDGKKYCICHIWEAFGPLSIIASSLKNLYDISYNKVIDLTSDKKVNMIDKVEDKVTDLTSDKKVNMIDTDIHKMNH